jgi:nicotinamide-nucleotide amidase
MITQLYVLSEQVGAALRGRGWTLVTAESCTGGWIAKAITDVPGSSAWFEQGFVTYSDAAKMDLLAVQAVTLQGHGAVSSNTVSEMAQGALTRSRAHLAVAVSGIAGPDGGTVNKPVGTVWLAWAVRDQASLCRCYQFDGDRDTVRIQAVVKAFEGVLAMLAKN